MSAGAPRHSEPRGPIIAVRVALCLGISAILSGCARIIPVSSTPSLVIPGSTLTSSSPDVPSDTPEVTLSTLIPTQIASAADAGRVFRSLLESAPSCPLPCLLGFDPSVASSADVTNFLEGFLPVYDSSDFSGGVDSGGARLSFFENDARVAVSFDQYHDGDAIRNLSLGGNVMSRTGEGQDVAYNQLTGSPLFESYFRPFRLSNILTTYGTPSEVLIAPFPADPDLRLRPDAG